MPWYTTPCHVTCHTDIDTHLVLQPTLAQAMGKKAKIGLSSEASMEASEATPEKVARVKVEPHEKARYLSPSLSLYIYIYTYTHVCVCIHIYIYTHMYIYRERERESYTYIIYIHG